MPSKHARHAPSSVFRTLVCSAWVSFTKNLPYQKGNYAASLGTAIHEISETILKEQINNLSTEDHWLGQEMQVEGDAIVIEQKHCDWSKIYTDYVFGREKELNAKKFIEQRVDVKEINPDLWGTADIILVCDDLIEIIDLKTGTWPVSPERNSQMTIYALGALIKHNKEDPNTEVIMTIVQPRAKNPIRSYTTTAEQLSNYAYDVLKPALDLADSENPVFVYDKEACRFCPGKAICTTFQQHNTGG